MFASSWSETAAPENRAWFPRPPPRLSRRLSSRSCRRLAFPRISIRIAFLLRSSILHQGHWRIWMCCRWFLLCLVAEKSRNFKWNSILNIMLCDFFTRCGDIFPFCCFLSSHADDKSVGKFSKIYINLIDFWILLLISVIPLKTMELNFGNLIFFLVPICFKFRLLLLLFLLLFVLAWSIELSWQKNWSELML